MPFARQIDVCFEQSGQAVLMAEMGRLFATKFSAAEHHQYTDFAKFLSNRGSCERWI
jgi:hypothetical protein